MIQDSKPDSYYDVDRSAFIEWVGGRHSRVLEIGCGTGRNAAWLRAHGSNSLTGVEPNEEAASAARSRFDEVLNEPVESALAKLQGPFDLIICADVLEHLVDPWLVLAHLRKIVDPNGELAISIPNVRHYRVIWEIAVGAGFAYPPDGRYDAHSIFDTTHLRFFTRGNLETMLEFANWRATRWNVPPRRRLRRIRAVIDTVTGGRAREWLTYQWYVVARPNGRDQAHDAHRPRE